MIRRAVRLRGPSPRRTKASIFFGNGFTLPEMLQQRQRMDYSPKQLINGIVLGSIYGLIASATPWSMASSA